jgi:hypothetical protein
MHAVEALKGLPGDEAADSLVRVALTDDAPNVRTEAALAAASKGRLHAVATGNARELATGNGAAPLSAVVALEDEFGLPEDVGSYPRFPVAVALTQRRWQAQRANILRQTIRAGLGCALAMATVSMCVPLFYALALPEDFREVSEGFVSLPTWMFVNFLSGIVIGSLLGTASGFAVGLADALWKGRTRGRWRLLAGTLAGLVHAGYLIVFCLIGAYFPSVPASVYIPVYILYGLLQGLIAAFVIPLLGTLASPRQQLVRSVLAGVASVLITIPCVYLLYVVDAPHTLYTRLVMAFALPFGIGMALSSRSQGMVEHSARSQVKSVSQ